MALTKDEIALELQTSITEAQAVPASARVEFPAVFDAVSFGECRHSHAEDALRNPRASSGYDAAGKKIILATKLVEPPRKQPFVLLVMAAEEDGGYNAYAGFRIVGRSDSDSIEPLAEDPSLAFATFIDRYAVPYEAGGISSKFSSLLLEPRAPDGSLQFLSGVAPSEHFAVSAFVKPTPDHVEVAWPFVIDGEAYRADLAAG